MGKLADVIPRLLGALGPTSIRMGAFTFAVCVLWRLRSIKDAVAAGGPVWLELFEPIGWAVAAAALWELGSPVLVRLRPRSRFHHMASRADTLADELSDPNNYYLRADPASPLEGKPRLEAKMESFKAELDALGIRDTPPVADVAKWKNIVPRLRGYMTNADLSGARAHRWIPMSREDLDDLTYMTSLRNQCDKPDREP